MLHVEVTTYMNYLHLFSMLVTPFYMFYFVWTGILAAADKDEATITIQQFSNGLHQAILNLCEMK